MTTATAVSPAQRQPELSGQTVVVIGGSSGIGLETARRARAEGAKLVLAGRNPDRLKRAAAELGALSSAALSTAASNSSREHDRNERPAEAGHRGTPRLAALGANLPIPGGRLTDLTFS
jgi:NAD(P)-dependent dehydrogenase (short-subunit alcohol dehydrogenase family)